MQLFESGKFSTKVENFPLCIFGLKFGKREGPEPENKISPKWKIFHQKWKNFHLCRMFQFMWFCKKKKFFFEVEKFPPKWKNFHFAYLGSNLANAKVQNPKTKFRQSGNFSTKSGKISTSAECSNSCDFGIKFFFWKFFKVENFPLKWKKFHFLYSGWSWAYLYVQMKNKISCQCGKFSTKSGYLDRHPALVLHVLCFRLIFLLTRNT